MKIEGHCHCGDLRWELDGPVEGVTACNCTICRRYGAIWAYGHFGQEIRVTGNTQFYVRGRSIEFHFCPRCACTAYYVVIKPFEDGRRKAAVNLRMITDPEKIQGLPIDHFDGLDKFEDLPRDGRCVKDLWF